MRRRQFITLLGGAALAPAVLWPRPMLAQQSARVRRIGVLIPLPESDAQARAEVAGFREALQTLGWAEGSAARFEIRWAGGEIDKIRGYAKELVALQPDVVLARTTPVTAALLKETRTIPVVFVNVSDPVGAGFAASMARPGGNATGFTNVEASLGGKWVEVIKEINPRVARIAIMFSPKTSPEGGAFYLRLIQDAARTIGVETVATPVDDAAAIEGAFVALAREPNVGLIVQPDVTTTTHRARIIALAAKHRVPAVYPFRFFTMEGGLVSYGIDVIDVYKRAAKYVDRILRGEKAGELAAQAPLKFELAINLKTAKALGIEIQPMLLGRADDVFD
jgi:putative ABC transport system substrate-binding protein